MERVLQSIQINSGVSVHLQIEVYGGQELIAEVEVLGNFIMSSERKEEFCEKLSNLIDEYKI